MLYSFVLIIPHAFAIHRKEANKLMGEPLIYYKSPAITEILETCSDLLSKMFMKS